MELVLVVFGLLASVLPIALTILAITHIVRHGAEWWWIAVVLFFPVMGSIAYFVASGALAGGRGEGQLFREMGRRRTARRRIAEARMRLQHGAPPAVEADLAEDLASLGEHAAAAPHFASALARLPERLDLAHGLARSLMAQGKCAEALPLLEKVCAANPRFAYGDAMLRLAQCLGESGQAEREEATLRELVGQSSIPEAQVRLAALCARTGRRQEAVELATRVLRDAPAWPRYLRAANRRWVRLARQEAAGQAPAMPTAASLLRTRRVPAWAMVAAGVLVALLVLLLVWVVLVSRSPRGPRIEDLGMLGRPAAAVAVSRDAGVGGGGWVVAVLCGMCGGRLSTLDS